MIGKTNSNSGIDNAYAYIICDYPEGSTCTATNSFITLHASNTNGHIRFMIPEPKNESTINYTAITYMENVSIDKTMFEAQIQDSGEYIFIGEHTAGHTIEQDTWTLNGITVNIIDYGIQYTVASGYSFSNGRFIIQYNNPKDWIVTATDGTNTMSISTEIENEADVKEVELYYFYGIKRLTSSSSPLWERYGMSKNYTATGSVGTTAGSSDFDKCYPWSEIQRTTVKRNDTNIMVKIPKFGFKRYIDNDSYEHIEIYPTPDQDHPAHIAFRHNNTIQDYIYVSAYFVNTSGYSVTGATPANAKNITQFRDLITSLNNNNYDGTWGLIDVATRSAIQALFLVEFATNNSQAAIGAGYTNASSNGIGRNSGQCDTVINGTGRLSGTDAAQNVVYRYIENPWGNGCLWLDGILTPNGEVYISTNQTDYNNSDTTHYTKLSYTLPSGDGTYITGVGYDSNVPEIMMPTANSGGSATTYYCDCCWDNSWSGSICDFNQARSDKTMAGLFSGGMGNTTTRTDAIFHGRSIFIPS